MALDEGAGREEDGALAGVAQLADVARPVVRGEPLLGVLGQRELAAERRGGRGDELLGEREDLVAALAQRRDGDAT
jgi:hypothetical protein